MPSLRHLSATIAAALTLALVGGCGGGDDGGDDVTKGLAPTEILARGRDAAGGLDSYRVALDAKVDPTVRPGRAPGGLAAILAAPVEIDGEGRVTRPNAMSLDVKLTVRELPVQANLTLIGGGVYLTVFGQDFKVGAAGGEKAGLRPPQLAATLLGWMESPTEVGREKSDGVSTVHLRGTVGAEAALGDLGTLAGALGGTPDAGAAKRGPALVKESTVDVWIGTADLLPRRIAIDARLQGRLDAIPELSALTLTANVRFSGFNDPVEITAPAGAKPLDLGDLPSLGC